MYSVAVKDHIMIAHSLRGDVFGPAQGVHGATFAVTTEYRCETLNDDGIVIDIGLATTLLREVLDPLRYQDLDKIPEFAGVNTTTEFLAGWIHKQVALRIGSRFHGRLRVILDESPMAWGSFEGDIGV